MHSTTYWNWKVQLSPYSARGARAKVKHIRGPFLHQIEGNLVAECYGCYGMLFQAVVSFQDITNLHFCASSIIFSSSNAMISCKYSMPKARFSLHLPSHPSCRPPPLFEVSHLADHCEAKSALSPAYHCCHSVQTHSQIPQIPHTSQPLVR